MLAMPGMRSFAVSTAQSADGVSCNAQGVFIGHVPLLERVDGRWMPRRAAELNDELTACYRLAVDIAAKANALSLIAYALNRGDLAMAAIAAVQMQIPDPPRLAKPQEKPEDIVRRARELARSGLLKAWEPDEHPRAGMPPNPGWFVPVDGSEDQGVRVAVKPGPNNPWAEFPDAEGGGGGEPASRPGSQNPEVEEPPAGQPAAPKPWTPPDPKSKLQFMGETPPQLAPYSGGKTSGIFTGGGITVELQSGYYGPTLNVPDDSSDFNIITMTHVEGHAAALMREMGISEAWLRINNTKICDDCLRDLETKMLPPGATFHVILPSGKDTPFTGQSR